LRFESDVSITTDPAIKAGRFISEGLMQKIAGTGTSIIRTGNAALSISGIIDVQTGRLQLTGKTVSLSGLIKGAGTIVLSTGNTTLEAETAIVTSGWTIAGTGAAVTAADTLGYAGSFSAGANTVLTIAAGQLLKLTGVAAFSRDTVDGAGRLITTGP